MGQVFQVKVVRKGLSEDTTFKQKFGVYSVVRVLQVEGTATTIVISEE